MEILDFLSKWWPLVLSAVAVIVLISKLDVRVAVIEEKIKTLFELWNKK